MKLITIIKIALVANVKHVTPVIRKQAAVVDPLTQYARTARSAAQINFGHLAAAV